MADDDDDFVYVSAIEGRAVGRYGSGNATRSNAVIGGVQRANGYEIDPNKVVRIPKSEWRNFAKEYGRAIKSKALKLMSRADYDAAELAAVAKSKAEAESQPKA